ncbi:peroxidase 24-like [Magnolia sinica]|uniref:peroxidase 24-like n=1 Tax=Magnolia sinica TaxID=86752 RepID=UPI00265AAA09|nr:peroxidase 24-like [Magnolia sinica]
MKTSFLLFVVCLGAVGVCNGGRLRNHFYRKSCPLAEDIVRNITHRRTAAYSLLPAKLLRLHFHDCFVRGCDASVLLNSKGYEKAEKDADPNLSLEGFDVIDEIKAQLEEACPGVVSCADIVALSARDSVSFQFNRSMWKVRTGRRDGNMSIAQEAVDNLPSPYSNFTALKQKFAYKSLNVRDLVVLSGGHTLGVSHCHLFSKRLYDFTGKWDVDSSLESTYADFLRTKCQSLSDKTTTVEMDPQSSLSYDNNYYVLLKQNKGLFQSDAALLTNKHAAKFVDELTNLTDFFAKFAFSMARMGKIEVLTGSSGEIRKKCSVVNSY